MGTNGPCPIGATVESVRLWHRLAGLSMGSPTHVAWECPRRARCGPNQALPIGPCVRPTRAHSTSPRAAWACPRGSTSVYTRVLLGLMFHRPTNGGCLPKSCPNSLAGETHAEPDWAPIGFCWLGFTLHQQKVGTNPQ